MLDPEPGTEPYDELERLDAEEQSALPDPAIRTRNRSIQLTAEDGLQINLYDHHADIAT